MIDWHGSRYVRLGIGSFALAVAVSLVAPPSLASAGAVRPKPGGASSKEHRKTYGPKAPAKQKARPGPAGPNSSAPQHSQPNNSAPQHSQPGDSGSRAAKPKPPQRKDRPPDRGAHKFSPQHKAAAPQRPNSNKNNTRKNNTRKNNTRKNNTSKNSAPRQDTQSSVPGVDTRAGGIPQAGGVPSNALSDFLNRLVKGFLDMLSPDRLSGTPGFQPAAPGKQTARQTQPDKRQAVPARPGKRKARQTQPDKRGANAARPDQQTRCGKHGCLTITPPAAKPKPKPRPRIIALDLTQDKEFRDRLADHEARRAWVYIDSEGHPTVGVGFNLDRNDAREALAAVGANYDDVRAGRVALTEAQIDGLLDRTVEEAVSIARDFFPGFDKLDVTRQRILADMAFNLGGPNLSEFDKLSDALEVGDYDAAADAMADSRWASQTGRRADRLIEEMRTGRPQPIE